MPVDASAGSRQDHRRRHRPRDRARRRPLVTVVLGAALGLSAIGCSTTPEASAPASSSTAGSADSAADASTRSPSAFELRPVVGLLPPGTGELGPDVVAGDGMNYRLGPAAPTNPVVTAAEAMQGAGPAGEVQSAITIEEGARGTDLFNEVARSCYAADTACPTGQLAFVLDGVVLSAPRIMPGAAGFEPFGPVGTSIAARFSPAEAEAIAARITST